MIILGINSYHPDSSAALMIDGKLVAACEEERFTRIKHFSGFPSNAIRCCLDIAEIKLDSVDYIVVPRDPTARAINKIIYGMRIPTLALKRIFAWKKTFSLKTQLSRARDLGNLSSRTKIFGVEHHYAHIASSYFLSGYDSAFVFSADALGDFASTMWSRGEGNTMCIIGEVAFPHSLGFYYTAVTQYLGFLNFGDEYKVMGLAPYGEDTFKEEFERILPLKENIFELNLKYFRHHKEYVDMSFNDRYPVVETIYSPYLEKRLGKRRMSDEPIQKRHKDIAFSLQQRLENVVVHMINKLSPKNMSKLCLAGGVAHNSALNGRLFERTPFKEIYVPPAPGDSGLAIGAAMWFWHSVLNKDNKQAITQAYWGPGFDGEAINKEIEINMEHFYGAGCVVEKIKNENDLCKKAALEISKGKIVGWFQGRMELGPRALGNRSILADPRREDMRDILNNRIKQREPFRPFAPSILEEHIEDYFECIQPSPFMSFVFQITNNKRNIIPAVCHVNGTARLQTVNQVDNPLYWNLIQEFNDLTGVPILLNTSLNENEPIVCSPREAINCFLRTKMDMLFIGLNVIRFKKD